MDVGMETMRISCSDCAVRETDACSDCVVTFILSREPDDAVILSLDEHRALGRLAASGLVPEVRHRVVSE